MLNLKNMLSADMKSRRFPAKPVSIAGMALLILLMIMLSLHHVFERAILQEISAMTVASSKQLDNLTLNLQRLLYNYGMQVFYSPSVKKLREYTNVTNHDRVIGLRELGTFATTSGFTDSIHVYNGRLGYIYTTAPQRSCAPVNTFYDRAAVEIFKNLKLADRLRPIQRDYQSATGGQGTSVCFSIVLFETDSESEPYPNAVMMNITPEWFGRLLLNGEGALIIDQNGEIVAAQQSDPQETLAPFLPLITDSIAQGDESGYFIGKGGKDRIICLYSKMATNDWVYLQTMRYNDCMSGLLALRSNAFFVFLLLIAFWLAGIFVSLIRVYFPFRRMVCSVTRIKAEDAGAASETMPLADRLDQFVERSIKMRPAFERMLHERTVRTLLERSEQVDAEILGLNTEQPVITLLIRSADCPALMALAQQYFYNVEGAIENGVTVLLIPTDDIMQVEQLCRDIHEQNRCRCLYSEPAHNFTGIPHSYQRLLELDMLHCLYPGVPVMCETLLDTRNKESSFNEKNVIALSSRLKAGELEAARNLYTHIVDSVSNDGGDDFLFALNRLNFMVEKLLAECAHSTCKPLELFIRPMEKVLSSADTPDTIYTYFDALFVEISRINMQNRSAKSRAVIESVISIVQSDYADPSLSARMIADSLGVSNIHLNRQFKAAQGCSLSDYLNRVRIDKACTLLREETGGIEEIAHRVGFENSKYFFVVFKSITGQTPRQYRLQDK